MLGQYNGFVFYTINRVYVFVPNKQSQKPTKGLWWRRTKHWPCTQQLAGAIWLANIVMQTHVCSYTRIEYTLEYLHSSIKTRRMCVFFSLWSIHISWLLLLLLMCQNMSDNITYINTNKRDNPICSRAAKLHLRRIYSTWTVIGYT